MEKEAVYARNSRRKFMKKLFRHAVWLVPYLKNPKWRTGIILGFGFCINAGNAVYNLISDCIFRSPWMVAAAIYYIILSLMRAKLINDVRLLFEQEMELEWERVSGVKSYRLCGLMMFGLEATMSGMVVQIVWQNHSYEYPGIMIYLFALYAFYCLSTAVRRVAKSKRTDQPELSAVKMLSVSKCI